MDEVRTTQFPTISHICLEGRVSTIRFPANQCRDGVRKACPDCNKTFVYVKQDVGRSNPVAEKAISHF